MDDPIYFSFIIQALMIHKKVKKIGNGTEIAWEKICFRWVVVCRFYNSSATVRKEDWNNFKLSANCACDTLGPRSKYFWHQNQYPSISDMPTPLPSQAFGGHLRRFVSLDGGANFVCLSGWVCANPRAIPEFFSIAKDERFYWKHKQVSR